MIKLGKYLYCIIESPHPEKLKFLNGASYVSFKDLAALTQDTPLIDYQNLSKEVLLKDLSSHQLIIEKVMQKYLPLPFKFGTWFESLNEIKDILRENYSFFKENLRSMQGKLEIEVMASFHNLENILKELSEDSKIKEFKEHISLSPTQEEKIKLGQIVKTLLDGEKTKILEEISKPLKEISQNFFPHILLNDQMILNYAFLIKNEDKDKFYKIIEKLNKIYQDKIDFKCIGPLPLYSFNTVEVKNLDFKLINQAGKTLELNERVNFNQIKENYRRLSAKYHPDRNKESKEKFEEISKAYEILVDFFQNYNFSLAEKDLKKEKILKYLKVEV
ncbi:MAG: GvpL/GvpF family gas vesicle protein [Armatimonadetes bacterium]|nr:GvpL/GvpF family gas vesicle protein [Armatimonadota bacterium]